MELILDVGTVAWFPGSAGSPPSLTLFAPGGQLPKTTLQGTVDVEGVVLSLAATSVPHSLTEFLTVDRIPERVGFQLSGNAVHLIYTVIVPASAVLLDDDGEAVTDLRHAGWIPFDDPSLGTDADSSPLQVRSYWRQALEETTAAFDLLPQYFTTSQVRSLYSSVWGTDQDTGNFHRWLHQLNAGICIQVDTDVIIDARSVTSEQLWRRLKVTGTKDAKSLLGRAAPGVVGTSVVALGALGGVLPLAVGAAIAGGAIAFQAGRQKGPQPNWYQRTHQSRQTLATLYGPRPIWLLAGE